MKPEPSPKGLAYLAEVFETSFMGHVVRVTIHTSKQRNDAIRLHLEGGFVGIEKHRWNREGSRRLVRKLWGNHQQWRLL